MTNMTLALPEELHAIMRKHKTVKWSEVARSALWEQARQIDLLDQDAVVKRRLAELKREPKLARSEKDLDAYLKRRGA